MMKPLDNKEGLPDIVELKQQRKPLLVLSGIILMIVMSLFFYHKSQHKEKVTPQEETYTLPQSNVIPIKSVIPDAKTEVKITEPPKLNDEQIAILHQKQAELEQRLAAPLMLVNNTQAAKMENSIQNNLQSSDRNTQFMQQVSAESTATAIAKPIGSLSQTIAEGTLIHAILESATNSDLPGYVRAIVDEPCYSEDGSQMLIPRGSRLIGQYKSGMMQGQSRIFMVWTRLITPSGLSLQLVSPGTDSLGMAGIGADEINRHFWERFGTASLLSMLGAGAANIGASASDQDNSIATYRSAIASSFTQSADQSLQQDNRIPPTLISYQGKPIMVFVARDLEFKESGSASIKKLIF